MKYESKVFYYETINSYTPEKYTYSVIKNKIRETGEQYYFEFDICDIITKEQSCEISCQCSQPTNIKDDQIKIFAMESFLRSKIYFENNPELLL